MRLLFFLLCVVGFSGTALAQRGALKPIKEQPGLPRVLLIGDSISIGYTLPTRRILDKEVNLHRIPTNGGPTSKGLEHLEAWLGEKEWDVIHFNWGLHDLCYRHPESKVQGRRDKVRGKVTHSVEEYAKNLEQLVEALKKSKAHLIFATTTPVPEGEAGRKVGDDLRYNKAATEVMARHKVAINDLHQVMKGKMGNYGIRPGDVHFKREGSQLLAEAVAASIRKALKSQ